MTPLQRIEYQGFDDAYFGNPKKPWLTAKESDAYEKGYSEGIAAPRVAPRRIVTEEQCQTTEAKKEETAAPAIGGKRKRNSRRKGHG